MTEQFVERVSIEHILPCFADPAKVMDCHPLFSGDYGEKRRELFRLLKASGYAIPGAFSAEGEKD